MNPLTAAQCEALLASASKHEEAAKEVRAIADRLAEAGYKVYAKELTMVAIKMISHVDHTRDAARNS